MLMSTSVCHVTDALTEFPRLLFLKIFYFLWDSSGAAYSTREDPTDGQEDPSDNHNQK